MEETDQGQKYSAGVDLGSQGFVVFDNAGQTIAKCELLADAQKIAASMNATPRLCEALEELVFLMNLVQSGDYEPDDNTCEPAMAALRAASGGLNVDNKKRFMDALFGGNARGFLRVASKNQLEGRHLCEEHD